MMSTEFMEDEFKHISEPILPFFMLLLYVLPLYRTISKIVTEKVSFLVLK